MMPSQDRGKKNAIPPNLPVRNGMKFRSKDQRALAWGPRQVFPRAAKDHRTLSQKGDFILDPFTGSGTTNLEAMMLGRNSVGVDIDPFSRFLARTKTKLLHEKELRKAYTKIKQNVSRKQSYQWCSRFSLS